MILKVVSTCEQIVVIRDGMAGVVYLVGATKGKAMKEESEGEVELSASTAKE